MYFPRHNLLNQLQYIAKKNSEAANYFVYLHKSGVYDFDPPTPPKKSTHFGDFFEVIEPVVEGKKGTPKLNAEGQPVFQGRFYRATDLNVFAYRFNPENPPRTTSSALTPVLLATEVNDDGVAETNTLRAFPYIVTPKINAELQDAQSSFKTQFFEEDGSQRTSSWGPAIAPLGGKFSWKKKDAIKALALALTDYIRQESNQTEIIRSELSCYHLKNQPEKDKKPTYALLYDLTCHAIFESLAKFSTFDEVSVETLTTSLINNPDYKRVTYFKGLGSFGKNRNQVYLALGFTVSSLTEKEAHVGLLAIEDNQIYFTPFDLADSPMEKWRSVLLCLMQNEYAKKWLGYIWKAMEVSPTPIELLEPPNVLMLGEKQSDCKLSTQSKSLLPFDIERSVFVPMIKISHLAKDVFNRMKCHDIYVKKAASYKSKVSYERCLPPPIDNIPPRKHSSRTRETPRAPTTERPTRERKPTERTPTGEQGAGKTKVASELERLTSLSVELSPEEIAALPNSYSGKNDVGNIVEAVPNSFCDGILVPSSGAIDHYADDKNRLFDSFFIAGLGGSYPNKTRTAGFLVFGGIGSTYDVETGVANTKPLHPRIAANFVYAPNTRRTMIEKDREGNIIKSSDRMLYGDIVQVMLPTLDSLKAFFALPITSREIDAWFSQKLAGQGYGRAKLAELDENTYNELLYNAELSQAGRLSFFSYNRSTVYAVQLLIQMRDLRDGKGLRPVFVVALVIPAGRGTTYASKILEKIKPTLPSPIVSTAVQCLPSVVVVPVARIRLVFPQDSKATDYYVNKYRIKVVGFVNKIKSLRSKFAP